MKVHLVGIGGAGMSALAHLYLERGDSVSGSDASSSAVTDALAAAGARIASGHDAASVGDPDLVVISTAIRDDNPELTEARRRGIKIVLRGRAAADIAGAFREVAIAGTHGKTTTTTMTAAALAHMDPLVLNGGRLPGSLYNSRSGHGSIAIVEADESDGSFLELTPEVGVVTNIEADHLDHYRDLGEIRRAFEMFAARISSTLVACVDDPGAAQLLAASPGDVVGYGFESADVRAFDYEADADGCRFRLQTSWGGAAVRLPVTGRHNARNAMAAIAVGLALGQPLPTLVVALETIQLPGRRMELVAEIQGARVYDDYGHHPTEVEATLAAAREICSGRLVCAFQPHRYSRLRAMMDAFSRAFAGADELLLLPVYGAGEAPIEGADSAALGRLVAATGKPVTVLESLEALPDALRQRLHAGDVAVCMGAGDIYKASRALSGAAA
ncbi:MAG: UDP-N-acetylmuramate--alanine ligase [Chloroflexota bacterium]|nr:UDP-N-acetylmuramate--alanine ligase [Chloroflexota bacterium]